ncbi:hypothetical protein BSY239_3686 [Hydrogenophaga sp. RAC07]|nr:hypothetical protein [Hydrogenophaga sp. RAC07]AOF85599.1 hypothetical protein BSY239_3686 [Hydrogenophaga sp. RAC07]
MIRVCDNPLCGSRNHLRAFSQALVAAGGVDERPQFLCLAEWTA